MRDYGLVLSSLKSRWFNSLLSVLLTAFGVMLAMLIIQFGHHIGNRIGADGKGIDIVIGAKGSPLQLILSSVYHVDIPTGNIDYHKAEKWMSHPQVKTAIPLALGDNWKGYRIVGTTKDYPAHYKAGLSDGRLWTENFEAVAGAAVGLHTGDSFIGAHGLAAGGHEHEEDKYKIVGVMEKTGTVLDRLILTSVESVLEIHGHHDAETEEEHEHGHSHHHDHEHEEHADEDPHEAEITALLLTTKSPIATINLPRMINRQSELQAANPAFEMTRLTTMLGMGAQSFKTLSLILIVLSSLSIFSGLAGSLENRMGDIAVLRALGYSKNRVVKIIISEAMVIAVLGVGLGIVFGLCCFSYMAYSIAPLAASGATVSFLPDFIWLALGVMLVAVAASVIPALRAGRVDVAKQLSQSY